MYVFNYDLINLIIVIFCKFFDFNYKKNINIINMYFNHLFLVFYNYNFMLKQIYLKLVVYEKKYKNMS
jgi:hypothetical protein